MGADMDFKDSSLFGFVARPIVIIALIVLTLSVVGCADTSQSNEGAESIALDTSELRQLISSRIQTDIEDATVERDREALSTRLNIPVDRVENLTDGDVDRSLIDVANGFLCAPGVCICDGDLDCNDMFSNVCRSPTTGGECYDNGICVCFPQRFSQ